MVAVHVLTAVVGFGALGATGAFARRARESVDPFASPSLLRYFRPGHNLAARCIFLVPLAGAGLLVLGHGSDVGAAWPWIGLTLWLIAAGLATAVLWPAEACLQELLSAGRGPLEELGPVARRLERSAACCTVIFFAAVAVMVIQPG